MVSSGDGTGLCLFFSRNRKGVLLGVVLLLVVSYQWESLSPSDISGFSGMKPSTLYKSRQPVQKTQQFEFANSPCVLKTLQGWVHGEGRPLVFLRRPDADSANPSTSDNTGRQRRAVDELPPADSEGQGVIAAKDEDEMRVDAAVDADVERAAHAEQLEKETLGHVDALDTHDVPDKPVEEPYVHMFLRPKYILVQNNYALCKAVGKSMPTSICWFTPDEGVTDS
eukprot:m.460573 g.460573  ORF g.460573 m.460573 type:complete len:225 (-) comp21596_c0_seq13:54-728(-)